MNHASPSKQLFLQNDDEAIVALIEHLIRLKYFISRPSRWHLKIGPVNYWTSTGTITVDGVGRAEQSGIEGLLKLLSLSYPPSVTHSFKRQSRPTQLIPPPLFEINLDDESAPQAWTSISRMTLSIGQPPWEE